MKIQVKRQNKDQYVARFEDQQGRAYGRKEYIAIINLLIKKGLAAWDRNNRMKIKGVPIIRTEWQNDTPQVQRGNQCVAYFEAEGVEKGVVGSGRHAAIMYLLIMRYYGHWPVAGVFEFKELDLDPIEGGEERLLRNGNR